LNRNITKYLNKYSKIFGIEKLIELTQSYAKIISEGREP